MKPYKSRQNEVSYIDIPVSAQFPLRLALRGTCCVSLWIQFDQFKSLAHLFLSTLFQGWHSSEWHFYMMVGICHSYNPGNSSLLAATLFWNSGLHCSRPGPARLKSWIIISFKWHNWASRQPLWSAPVDVCVFLALNLNSDGMLHPAKIRTLPHA